MPHQEQEPEGFPSTEEMYRQLYPRTQGMVSDWLDKSQLPMNGPVAEEMITHAYIMQVSDLSRCV